MTSETLCDERVKKVVIAHINNTGCLLRFLRLGKLMAPRKSILFVIRCSLPCSKQPNTCAICPFQTLQP